jgi:hypothetical protein
MLEEILFAFVFAVSAVSAADFLAVASARVALTTANRRAILACRYSVQLFITTRAPCSFERDRMELDGHHWF